MKNILHLKKPLWFLFWSIAFALNSLLGWSQVGLTNSANTVTINFSNTVAGVSNGAYTAAGFSASPSSGQLDSDAWAVTGWSDGSVAFGGSNSTGDLARGTTSAAVTTGGFYAYTGSPGSSSNPSFMIQPGGSDFAPGTLTLRIKNNGTTDLTQLTVSYNIYVRNDQARSNSFNFSHSINNSTYTSVSALDYTSTAAADSAGWVLVGSSPSRSTTITGLDIAPGAFFYIRWSSADVGGSGSRDEFGLDDISITGTFDSGCTSQTITALTTPVNKPFGSGTYSVATTASSGLAVSYGSSNTNVATVNSSGIVTLVGVGTATITASQAGNTTYCAATSVTQALTVSKGTPVITGTATATDITYGQTLASSIISGLSANTPGTFAFTSPSTAPNAGTASYSVTFTPSNTTNFNTATTTVSVTTLKANSTITATGAPSFTYNGLPQGPGTATVTGSNGAITYSYSGTSYGPTAVKPTNSGDYEVVATVAANTNFDTASSAPYAFTINKALLTVTADDKTAIEGTTIPAFTVSYTNFQNGDTEADLTTAPTATSPTADINIVGNYPIVADGGASDNYSFNYVDGNFNVTSATTPACPVSTTTAPAENQSVCEESAVSELTATIFTAGAVGTPTLSYQWYYNTTNSNTVSGATLIPDATSSTYTPLSTSAEVGTRYYFCVGYASDNDCAQNNALQSLASNAVQVEVKAKPTATITPSGTTTFCSGGSVNLTANSGTDYLWSNGATTGTVNVTSTGSYSVQVTVNGCQSEPSTITAVTVNSLPATPTITPNGTVAICQGESITLSSSSDSGNTWSNSATTQDITVTSAGSYSVRYVDGNGCQSASSATTTVTLNSALVVGTVNPIVTGTPGPNVVISQIYGGGGNSGATYKNDFVELFNPTANTVNLNGWAIQHASATGTTWTVTPLSGSIAAGGYYLIQQDQGSGGTTNLPTPDAIDTIAMGATSGKDALTNSTTPLSGAIPGGTGPTIVDFVGYASGTFSGTAAAPAPSNSLAILRTNVCVDANSNSTEFATGTPNPRNSATPVAACGTSSSTQTICAGTAPSSVSVTAASGSTGSFTYQWYSFNGITAAPTGSTIPVGWTLAGTGLSFTPGTITQNTTFACYVVPTGCTGRWSGSQRQVTVTAVPNAVITQTDTSGTPNDNAICLGASTTLTASGGTSYSWNTNPIRTTAAITVSPTTDTTYTVTVRNAAGCSSTAQVTIAVNPTPTAVITPSGPTTFYEGNDVTLTASGGDTYSWNTNPVETTDAIIVSPLTTTTYIVTVRNASGCSDTEQITVNIIPSPTFGNIVQFYNLAPPCSGSEEAFFDVNGLLPNAYSTLYYTINNGPVASVALDISSPSGYSSFTLPVTFANNGQILRVTAVETTGAPVSNVTVIENGSSAIALAVTEITTWYRDADGDGFGNFAITTTGCTQPSGYVSNSLDCNDSNFDINPGVAEICYNGIDDDCDTLLSEGCAPALTNILPGFHNSTLATAKSTITASTATYSGPFTVSYLFRIKNLTTNAIVELPRAFRNFNLGMTDIIAYGTSYSVEVAAVISGEQQPFSTPSIITTPSIPTTKLVHCGGTVTSISSSVACNSVAYALGYQFEIAQASNLTAVKEVFRLYNNFSMILAGSAPDALPLLYDTEYRVRVKAKVLIDGDEVWGNYGEPCIIRTPAAPEVYMTACAEQGIHPANLNTQVYSNNVAYASMYRFTIYNDEGYSQSVERTFNSFRLSDFNALALLTPGATYSVVVDVKLFDNYYLGKDCEIVIPGGVPSKTQSPKQTTLSAAFEAKAYPNPFANNFMINVSTQNESSVNIKVYDMMGRLVDQKSVQVNNMEASPIGDSYPSGVYNVVITQGEDTKTLRVVKR